jgi:hypothetical protein
MSRLAEDFQESEITEPAVNHESVSDWPVAPIPNEGSRKADEIPSIIGEAAARTLGQLNPEEDNEPEPLTEEQLEIARRYGVRYGEFEDKIISIQDDIVSHRPTDENIGHYFGAIVSGSINRPDKKYNLDLKELTKEGYEDLCRKYNPAASAHSIRPERLVDKPTSHGKLTDSGKINLPFGRRPQFESGRKFYTDGRSAAGNDFIEKDD